MNNLETTTVVRANVNRTDEWRVYRSGEIIGTFTSKRNAELFAVAETMYNDLCAVNRGYPQISLLSPKLDKSIKNTLSQFK